MPEATQGNPAVCEPRRPVGADSGGKGEQAMIETERATMSVVKWTAKQEPDEKALGKMEQQQGDVEQKLVRLATRKGLLEKQLADAAQEQARGDFIERVREADALRDEAAVAGIAFSKALADLQTKGTQAYEAAGKYLKERSRLREAAQAMGLEQTALEDLRALPVDPEIQTVFVEIRRLARTHVILW